MKIYVPFGLLLFSTGVVAGLCMRSRPARREVLPEQEGVDYLREAGAIDLFQIEAGKLARSRAIDPDVQTYAEKMVKHHQRSLLLMRRAARLGGFDVDRFPGLTGHYQDLLAGLRSTPDHLFDSVYLRLQAQVHEAGLVLHDGVDIVPLSQPAMQAVEMMAGHLDEVEALIERRRPGSVSPGKPAQGKGRETAPAKPPGQPQTPNQTPGDGGPTPFVN